MQTKAKLLLFIIGMSFCIAGCGSSEGSGTIESTEKSSIVVAANAPECFELIREIPYMVRGGQLYQYTENNEWLPIEREKTIVQLVSSEYLCGVYDDGTIFYDGNLTMDGYMPNGSAYVFFMGNKLLELNRDEPIRCISEYLGAGCVVLSKNGELFYPNKDKGE